MKKTNKGITLIALIITIVVMLILVGVTVSTVSDSKLIGKTKDAKNMYTISEMKDIISSKLHERFIEKTVKGSNAISLKEDLEKIEGIDSVEEVNEETCYVTKGEYTITVYDSGAIETGKVDIWDGTSSDVPEINGLNWYIHNAAQFKFFADFVNNGNKLTTDQTNTLNQNNYEKIEDIKIEATTTISLMADLDFNESSLAPTGNATNKFIAIFDGRDHFIKNVNIISTDRYVGLFGNSTNEIKDLTIKDSYIEGGTAMIGGIVGLGQTVTNCKNENTTVKQTTDGFAGGVAGRIDKKISYCTNTGDITGKNYTGGVLGGINTSASIDNCTNNGAVSGIQSVGGIVGFVRESGSISDCVNNKKVTATGDFVGGIAGVLNKSIIDKSYNYGEISSNGDNVGGISGNLQGGSEINTSDNYGSVYSTGDYVGGIAGANISSNTIYNCVNSGNISSQGVMTGGIAGKNAGIVESSTNSGVVTGEWLVGGITGYLKGTIERCGNTGTIKQPETTTEDMGAIGGLVGEIGTNSTISIQYCYNRGPIEINIPGTEGVGGIVGWISIGGGTSGILKDTYNTGLIQINVENVIGVGGLTGKIESDAVKTGNNYCVEGITKVEPSQGWAVSGTINSLETMQQATYVNTLNTGLETPEWEIRTGENDNYPVPRKIEKTTNESN